MLTLLTPCVVEILDDFQMRPNSNQESQHEYGDR